MVEKVSTRQIIFLIIISRIANILTIMPVIHMFPNNQDTWIVIIVSFFYTVLICIPILFLSHRFNDLTIIGYMEKIFGKILGKFVAILYAMFFIRATIMSFYTSIQMIRSTFMTELLPMISIFILIVSCTYIVSRGLEVLARFVELFGSIILSMILVFALLGYNNIDLSILLPVYKDSSFFYINLGALEVSLIFTDIYILAMVGPHLKNKKDLNKILIKSLGYSLLIILVTVVVTQTALGIEQTRHSNFPFLTYVRCVRTYSIFERIESIFLIVWILSIITRIVAYFYISINAITEIFKKRGKNIFLYMLAIIITITTYYLAEINPMMGEIILIKFPEYIFYFILEIIIPLIAIVVYLFRKKSFEKQEKLGN